MLNVGEIMPHCIIEHSAEICAQQLIDAVHQGALKSDLFEAKGSDIKVRALPYKNFKTGSVTLNFIHVTLKILSGRNNQQKKQLTTIVLAHIKELSLTGCSISVEVVDIDKDSYAKFIS
jgi:5-carboxymethyl-2-hydroxymuconate isomerase